MKKILLMVLFIFLIISCRKITHYADDYYYGFGVKQDYKKAFELYSAKDDKDYTMLTIMYINGDGVKEDLQKAIEMAKEIKGQWLQKELLNLVDKKRKSPDKSTYRASYCDIAWQDTYNLTKCSNIWKMLMEKKCDDELKTIGRKLHGKAAGKYKKLLQKFEVFKKIDTNRVYIEHIDGNWCSMQANSYEEYLIENNRKLVSDMVEKRRLNPATNDELNIEKNKVKSKYKELNEEMAGMLNMAKEINSDDINYYEEYPTILKNAENSNEQYISAWIDLMLALKPKGMAENEIIIAVEKTLLKQRLEQLK